MEDRDSPWSLTDFSIDIEQLSRGPDTWNHNQREGWAIYLVNCLPINSVYAVTRYGFNEDEQLFTIGKRPSVDGNIDIIQFNDALKRNGVEPVTEKQFNELVKPAYNELIIDALRNGTLDRRYQVGGITNNTDKVTVYSTSMDVQPVLESRINRIYDDIDALSERKGGEIGLSDAEQEQLDVLREIEPLTEEQLDSLSVIPDIVKRPHTEGIDHAENSSLVGEVTFDPLERHELRTIELVHSSVFKNNPSVALVYALSEEGVQQSHIADRLNKTEGTVSKQLTKAEDLIQRARWTTENTNISPR